MRNPQPLAHTSLRLLPAERNVADVLDRRSNRVHARSRVLALDATRTVLATDRVPFLHHTPRLQPSHEIRERLSSHDTANAVLVAATAPQNRSECATLNSNACSVGTSDSSSSRSHAVPRTTKKSLPGW